MEYFTRKNNGNECEQAIINKNVSSTDIGRVMVCISPQEASVEVEFEPGASQSWERCMQKVPLLLRREGHNKWEYDPAVVSLGPYHHGKEELCKLAEDFKPKALELYAAGSGMDTSCFYTKVLEVIDDLRRCYVENSTDQYDDAVFARMMLHDACFIINYIHVTVTYQKEMLEASIDHLGMLAFKLTLRDMFLLENQIPLWFLKIFMYLKYGEDEGEEMLNKFLSITLFGEYKQKGESNKKDKEPLHLLEAFRRILVADCRKDDETKQYWSMFQWLSLKTARIGKTWQRHSLLKFKWPWKRKKIYHGRNLKKYVHSFRSVRDLKAKGIQFRPSPTDSLKDVKFKAFCFYAELHLPTWSVSIYTKVLLLNMIAFEMCPNTATDQTVSTFINFVKSLIESPEDVKELREKKIIFHTLGSDEEVVQVYKDINTYGVNNYALFHKIREKIQERYNSKAKTWVAELIHTYFRSPWTAIALLAAVFLLCVTFLQTYFTIHPSCNK